MHRIKEWGKQNESGGGGKETKGWTDKIGQENSIRKIKCWNEIEEEGEKERIEWRRKSRKRVNRKDI